MANLYKEGDILYKDNSTGWITLRILRYGSKDVLYNCYDFTADKEDRITTYTRPRSTFDRKFKQGWKVLNVDDLVYKFHCIIQKKDEREL